MELKLKFFLKNILARMGLYHPSLKIKISSEAKAELLLRNKKQDQKVFIETGTHRGDMIERMKDKFDEIYSIEIDKDFYLSALERFKDDKKVRLFHGDSARVIEDILNEVKRPALIWLDAHASGPISVGNSPILGELNAIFNHSIRDHVILIDDARMFDRKSIKVIKNLSKRNNYKFCIKNGIFILK